MLVTKYQQLVRDAFLPENKLTHLDHICEIILGDISFLSTALVFQKFPDRLRDSAQILIQYYSNRSVKIHNTLPYHQDSFL